MPIVDIGLIENAVRYILSGVPLGYALIDLRQRQATAFESFHQRLSKHKEGFKIRDQDLVLDWAEASDARGYVLIGDPAIQFGMPAVS
jgi:hypothetical protein